jgi:hypothetical protein
MTGQPGQDNQDRTGRNMTGRSRPQNMTVRPDRQNRTGKTGQTEQDRQNVTGRTGTEQTGRVAQAKQNSWYV